MHKCHKLWTEICEVWPIFKVDMINFCEILTKMTLKLYQNSQDGLKFCEISKILWDMASRWAKFCEILSHSVRYGMYVDVQCGLCLLCSYTVRSLFTWHDLFNFYPLSKDQT